MPALVPRDNYKHWLDKGLTDPDGAKALLHVPTEKLEITPVSREVNKSDNEGEQLIEPVGPEVTTHIKPN